MAALVTNKTQANALSGNSFTAAAVGGAGGAMPAVGNSGFNGIDDANSCQFLESAGASTSANTHYSAWITIATATNGYSVANANESISVNFRQQNLTFNTYTSASDSIWFILFSDGGTTNYARWEMNIQDIIDGSWYPIIMSGTPDNTGGTFNDTDVTGFGVAIETNTTGTNFGIAALVDQLVSIDGDVIWEDTGAAAQLNFESYYDESEAFSGNTFHSLLNEEIKPVWFFAHPTEIRADDFSASNFTVGFLPNNATKGYVFSTTDYHRWRFAPDLATATHLYEDGTFVYDSGTYDFEPDGSNLTTGTMTFRRCLCLSTRDVVITGSQVTFDACTFPSPNSFNINDGSTILDLIVDGCAGPVTIDTQLPSGATVTVTNPTADALQFDYNGVDDTGRTFNVPGGETINYNPSNTNTFTHEGITRVGSGNITFDNLTALDFTVNVSADVFANSTTASTGGGTITLSGPTDDLTININESGCQIHVYTTNTYGSSAVLLDSEASASQLVFTHSGQTVDITVNKQDFIPYRETGRLLSGDVQIDVQLVASRESTSSHGLTYGTSASIYDNISVVTNITAANPPVVTYSGADIWTNNDVVSIHDVIGMTEINGEMGTVANLNTTANTFELSGVDASAFTAYSSGGVVLSGLSVGTFGPTGVNVFSLLLESMRTQTALRNLPWNLQMDGSKQLFLTAGVEGESDTDITNLTKCGVTYLDKDAAETAQWLGMESIGEMTGFTAEYQQQAGTGTADARASGAVNELIKTYGDTDHGNFDYRSHHVVKAQPNGYVESRADLIALSGLSTLIGELYTFPLAPAAISDFTTGDPGVTGLSITNHGATPVSWDAGDGAKDYSLTITDTNNNTGEDIQRWVNYNKSLDTTFQSEDPFNWGEIVRKDGTKYRTGLTILEGSAGATDKGCRVIDGSSNPHPDFARFQADDGTFGTPPASATFRASNVANGANYMILHRQIFGIAAASINTTNNTITITTDTNGDSPAFDTTTANRHTLIRMILADGATIPTTSTQILNNGTYRVLSESSGVIQIEVTEGGGAITFSDQGTNNGSGALMTLVFETLIAEGTTSGGTGAVETFVLPDGALYRFKTIHQDTTGGPRKSSKFIDVLANWSDTAGATYSPSVDATSATGNQWTEPNRIADLTSFQLEDTVEDNAGSQITDVDPVEDGADMGGLTFALEGRGFIQVNSGALTKNAVSLNGALSGLDLAMWGVYQLGLLDSMWLASDETLVFDGLSNLTIDNVEFDETSGNLLQIYGTNIREKDGSPIVTSTTTGAIVANIATRGNVGLTETGTSGLTASESTELFKNSTILNLVEADEVHTSTTVQKRLKGTSTPLLTKNHTGTPLTDFEATE